MDTLLRHAIGSTYGESRAQVSLASRFLNWCDTQEKYRFGWLAAIITGHGCVITPITLFAIILSGNSFIFWAIALVAMAASLVANLAAMPTKITIPVFVFSLLIDLTIIVICISNGLSVSSTYLH